MKSIISILTNYCTYDSRVMRVSRSLIKNNYRVQVVALFQEGLEEKEVLNSVPITRIKLKTKRWGKNYVVQLVKYLEYTYKIAIRYRDIDIIHCNDLAPLPLSVMVKLISKRKIKIVYDAHELETETKGLSKAKRLILRLTERFFIRFTDAFITVSDSIAQEYCKMYGVKKPAVVLNCPDYNQVKRNNIFREIFKLDRDKVIFLYQGRFSIGRGLENLIEAFVQCKNERIILVLMGYGPLQEWITKRIAGSEKIFYHPAVPPDEVLNYTAAADIGVAINDNICKSSYYCLPNKLFEYAMAGLPILARRLPEIEILINKYNCGVMIKTSAIDDIMIGIDCILNKDLDLFSRNAKYLASDYCWQNQEAVLLEVYENLN